MWKWLHAGTRGGESRLVFYRTTGYTGVKQATFDGFKDKGITMFFPFG